MGEGFSYHAVGFGRLSNELNSHLFSFSSLEVLCIFTRACKIKDVLFFLLTIFCMLIFAIGSCRYARCTLSSWSSWSDLSLPVDPSHCASQSRTRSYSLTWLYTERQRNCNGVAPQSCPSNIRETREKSE